LISVYFKYLFLVDRFTYLKEPISDVYLGPATYIGLTFTRFGAFEEVCWEALGREFFVVFGCKRLTITNLLTTNDSEDLT
jgi:hypothetical protein